MIHFVIFHFQAFIKVQLFYFIIIILFLFNHD